MFIPSMMNLADVVAESGYTEEQVFDLGIDGSLTFLVVVPEVGACRVPAVALSHFMAGADEYSADAMPEHYTGALSGRWVVKRDRLRILPESWQEWVDIVSEIDRLDLLNGTQQARSSDPVAYHLPMFARLEPRIKWQGSRITHTDILSLEEAAAFASKHAGEEITPKDFLRAAGRGEILLKAIVHRTSKVQAHDGGIYCNHGEESENIVPAGCIANLPVTACQHLANAGRASWRTFDGFEKIDGVLMRYAQGMLTNDEPDFETVPADCRVSGYDVHALADAFHDRTPDEPRALATAPEVAKSASDADAAAATHWKMRVQAQAADKFVRLRKSGANPTVYSILDDLVRWCAENDVRTERGVIPSANYLRVHVLSGKHWTPPR